MKRNIDSRGNGHRDDRDETPVEAGSALFRMLQLIAQEVARSTPPSHCGPKATRPLPDKSKRRLGSEE
jgi:hypothetical protein